MGSFFDRSFAVRRPSWQQTLPLWPRPFVVDLPVFGQFGIASRNRLRFARNHG